MDFMEALTNGGVVTLIGMGTVFAVLAVLWGILELMQRIFVKAEKAPKKAEAKKPETVPAAVEALTTDDEELIAVLTAAVAASLNTSTYNLQIKSYRQVGAKAPAWNRVSRRENLQY
ncbi:MAG: OadG family protein [Clostridia bacterium]|nr:OadG family protein [Clostridia bacterium]